jgi:hypothetical protein
VRPIEAVRQNYQPTRRILELLEDFQLKVNDCIRIGIKENITSKKSLSLKLYHYLGGYVHES